MAKTEETPEPSHTLTPPEGFQQADTDVDNFAAWDFDKQGELRGTVTKVKTVSLVRRGEEVDVRMAIVAVEGGELICLWESANLGDFFDSIQKDHQIVVQPAGHQSLSGGRSMKVFHAYFR